MAPYEVIRNAIMKSDLKDELDASLASWSLGNEYLEYSEDVGGKYYYNGVMYISSVLWRWITNGDFNTKDTIWEINGDSMTKISSSKEIDPDMVALVCSDIFQEASGISLMKLYNRNKKTSH